VTELGQTCRRDRADITQSPNQNFHVASLSTGTPPVSAELRY
jgi:hypothetical protein